VKQGKLILGAGALARSAWHQIQLKTIRKAKRPATIAGLFALLD
jgi:hypothetical protein